MLHLSFSRSNLEDVQEPTEEYLRPTSYRDAINTQGAATPKVVVDQQMPPEESEEEEFQNDPFADYCDRDFVEFYSEFEQYLHENSLMQLGKSYEVLNIIYDCIELIENTTDSGEDTDEEYENEDCMDYYC